MAKVGVISGLSSIWYCNHTLRHISQSVLRPIMEELYYCPHFTDEKTEALVN